MPPYNPHTTFLGVVVNPKTFEPIFLQRRENKERTVDIIARTSSGYGTAGSGYLDENGSEYLRPTTATGYPRCHTPDGVRESGGGFGTALYTGLVCLATLSARRDIATPHLAGSGEGICSESDTRSTSADRWWNRAYERDLTERDDYTVEGGETEEDLDNERADHHLSRRAMGEIRSLVEQEFHNQTDWHPYEVRVEVDLRRTVSDETEIQVDTYLMTSAVEHDLVCVLDVEPVDLPTWARMADAAVLEADVDAILALNVARQDPMVVARLAAIARENGASEVAITQFLQRAEYGVDLIKPVLLDDIAQARTIRPEDLATLAKNPKKRRRRRRGVAPPSPHEGGIATLPPTYRMNPARAPSMSPTARDRAAIERNLEHLIHLREALGWTNMGDL